MRFNEGTSMAGLYPQRRWPPASTTTQPQTRFMYTGTPVRRAPNTRRNSENTQRSGIIAKADENRVVREHEDSHKNRPKKGDLVSVPVSATGVGKGTNKLEDRNEQAAPNVSTINHDPQHKRRQNQSFNKVASSEDEGVGKVKILNAGGEKLCNNEGHKSSCQNNQDGKSPNKPQSSQEDPRDVCPSSPVSVDNVHKRISKVHINKNAYTIGLFRPGQWYSGASNVCEINDKQSNGGKSAIVDGKHELSHSQVHSITPEKARQEALRRKQLEETSEEEHATTEVEPHHVKAAGTNMDTEDSQVGPEILRCSSSMHVTEGEAEWLAGHSTNGQATQATNGDLAVSSVDHDHELIVPEGSKDDNLVDFVNDAQETEIQSKHAQKIEKQLSVEGNDGNIFPEAQLESNLVVTESSSFSHNFGPQSETFEKKSNPMDKIQEHQSTNHELSSHIRGTETSNGDIKENCSEDVYYDTDAFTETKPGEDAIIQTEDHCLAHDDDATEFADAASNGNLSSTCSHELHDESDDIIDKQEKPLPNNVVVEGTAEGTVEADQASNDSRSTTPVAELHNADEYMIRNGALDVDKPGDVDRARKFSEKAEVLRNDTRKSQQEKKPCDDKGMATKAVYEPSLSRDDANKETKCKGSTTSYVVLDNEEEKADYRSHPRILTLQQMEMIASRLPLVVRHGKWTRSYSLSRDGDTFHAFLFKLRARPHTILVVKTTNGNVFGAYTPCPWEAQLAYYGSCQTFLFSVTTCTDDPPPVEEGSSLQYVYSQLLCSCFQDCNVSDQPQSHKRERQLLLTYGWTGQNTYIQFCSSADKRIALGGGGAEGSFGLCVEQNFRKGSSGPCATFGNEALSEDAVFDVLDLEVYTISSALF